MDNSTRKENKERIWDNTKKRGREKEGEQSRERDGQSEKNDEDISIYTSHLPR
jgi:hypothetical protein